MKRRTFFKNTALLSAIPILNPFSVLGRKNNSAGRREIFGVTKRNATVSSTIINTDFRELASRADLEYVNPVIRSEEGMPVGTGRMGSLVWTTPTAIKLQVNRVDVFPLNKDTRSRLDSRWEDYCGGCAYVDIDLVDFGGDVFTGPSFCQHLSVYDGVVSIKGNGVSARVVASQQQDVFAIEVDDRREQPGAVSVDLRMLRAVQVDTDYHTATSRLDIRGDRIILMQEFREGGYYCASAVAAAVVGRPTMTRYASESAVRLSAAPGKGKFTILLASAASFDQQADVVAEAMAQLDRSGADFAAVHAVNESFWQDFWSRSFIRLGSADGTAEFVEQNYTYFLYLMASSSRGKLPVKFNGMLWITKGDQRNWGSLYWWHNTHSYYNSTLMAANHLELMDPMFDMFTAMYDACALAARQQWGSEGIFIPQTVGFDGLAELPDDIAEEMRELYLLRKLWEKRSNRFRVYAAFTNRLSSRWNWIARLPHNSYTESVRRLAGKDAEYPHYRVARLTEDGWGYTDWGCGPYGHTNHIFYSGAEIAYLYWLRYEYTLDRVWLCDRAYPMLKGVAEFYRNYPNVKKGEDGNVHIHNVNNHEGDWGGKDTIQEITAMHGILPLAIRASQILGMDVDLRQAWRQLLEDLAPFPRNDHPDAIEPKRSGEQLLWITTLKPVRLPGSGYGAFTPVWSYDLCTIEMQNPERRAIGTATYLAHLRRRIAENKYLGNQDPTQRSLPSRSKLSLAAAILGRAGDIKMLIPAHFNNHESGPNRMALNIDDVNAEHLGMASDALHRALCQRGPAGPGKESVIRVFPAWPRDWDAEYTLGTRGGFLVTSAMRGGRIEFVEMRALAASECLLRNPWGEGAVTLYRNGELAGDLAGSLLRFPVVADEVVVVVPVGTTLGTLKRRLN